MAQIILLKASLNVFESKDYSTKFQLLFKNSPHSPHSDSSKNQFELNDLIIIVNSTIMTIYDAVDSYINEIDAILPDSFSPNVS